MKTLFRFLLLAILCSGAHAQHNANPQLFSAYITPDILGPVTAPDLRQYQRSNQLVGDLLADYVDIFGTASSQFYGRAWAFGNLASLLEHQTTFTPEVLRGFAYSNHEIGNLLLYYSPSLEFPAAYFYGSSDAFLEVAELLERTEPPVLPPLKIEVNPPPSPLRAFRRDET